MSTPTSLLRTSLLNVSIVISFTNCSPSWQHRWPSFQSSVSHCLCHPSSLPLQLTLKITCYIGFSYRSTPLPGIAFHFSFLLPCKSPLSNIRTKYNDFFSWLCGLPAGMWSHSFRSSLGLHCPRIQILQSVSMWLLITFWSSSSHFSAMVASFQRVSRGQAPVGRCFPSVLLSCLLMSQWPKQSTGSSLESTWEWTPRPWTMEEVTGWGSLSTTLFMSDQSLPCLLCWIYTVFLAVPWHRHLFLACFFFFLTSVWIILHPVFKPLFFYILQVSAEMSHLPSPPIQPYYYHITLFLSFLTFEIILFMNFLILVCFVHSCIHRLPNRSNTY